MINSHQNGECKNKMCVGIQLLHITDKEVSQTSHHLHKIWYYISVPYMNQTYASWIDLKIMLRDSVATLHNLLYIQVSHFANFLKLRQEVCFLTSHTYMSTFSSSFHAIYIHHLSCPCLQLHCHSLGVYVEGDDAMYAEEDNYGAHHLQN
jgi:hypothetical protein